LYLHMGHLAAGQNVVGERLDPDGWLSRIRRGTQTNKNENRVALFGGWSMRADRHELTRQSAFPTQKRPFHCSLLTGAFLWAAPSHGPTPHLTTSGASDFALRAMSDKPAAPTNPLGIVRGKTKRRLSGELLRKTCATIVPSVKWLGRVGC